MNGNHRKYGSKTDRTERGTFARGNPGKPRGARHRTTLAVESLLDGEAEKLTRKAVEMALGGDTVALRMCMDRISPPRKDRLAAFPLPTIVKAADAVRASAKIVAAVAVGELTPSEAAELAGVVAAHIRTLVAVEFEERLARLESRESK